MSTLNLQFSFFFSPVPMELRFARDAKGTWISICLASLHRRLRATLWPRLSGHKATRPQGHDRPGRIQRPRHLPTPIYSYRTFVFTACQDRCGQNMRRSSNSGFKIAPTPNHLPGTRKGKNAITTRYNHKRHTFVPHSNVINMEPETFHVEGTKRR
jgi:hypothetical protein